MHVYTSVAACADIGRDRSASMCACALVKMAALSLQSVKALRDGRSIPVLGLGTYLGAPEAVKIALALGYRLIDTASLYESAIEHLPFNIIAI